MFLDAPRFRNLSLKKDLCPAAKALNVKVRGLGKYELANKLAKALIEKGFGNTQWWSKWKLSEKGGN